MIFAAIVFAVAAFGWAFASVTTFLVGCAMAICAALASIAALANFIFAAATITTSTTSTVVAAATLMVTTVTTHAETKYPSGNYA